MFKKIFKKENKLKVFIFILLIVGIGITMYKLNNTKDLSIKESEASFGTVDTIQNIKLDLDDIKVKSSSTRIYSNIDNMFDGNTSTSWNSGRFAPSWIQLDLGSLTTISKISLNVNQFPSGNTKHVIMGGPSEDQLKELEQIVSFTENRDWIYTSFTSSFDNIRYIRIITEKSPSWVSWREIEVYSPVKEKIQTIVSGEVFSEQDLLIDPCIQIGETPTVLNGIGLLNQSLGVCESSSFAWTLGLQSESAYGNAGNCKNFPAINSYSSPLTFDFLDRGNGTYAVSLGMDLDTISHPCGENYFTWYMLMHQDSDYVYPLPTELVSSHKVLFTKTKRDGGSRLIAAMNGFIINIKDADPQPFSIELALNIDEEWGDSYPDSPYISYCSISECGSTHIFLDGSYFGLEVKEGVESTIEIPWYKVYNFLIEAKILPTPYINNGAYLSTGSVSLGYEVNNFKADNSYKVNLIQSEFKIKKK